MFDLQTTGATSHFAIDEVYSVSDFLKQLNTTLRESVPQVWISGEISNLTYASSGHIYLSLKDEHSVVKCVIFRLSAKRIQFELSLGLHILVNASPNIYEARGDMQLVIAKVEPVGVGAIELALKQLKEKLAKQGLFDIKHKKPLVKYPDSVGIITSKKGAVIQDIIRILSMRYPLVKLFIYDVITQGELACGQIIHALKIADTKHHDALIIARGGGSSEDLFTFNDESLAYAVFAANTPVISSIGHEIDITILDYVADYSVATPSAAAMVVAPNSTEIYEYLSGSNERMMLAINAIYNRYETYCKLLFKTLATPTLDNKYLLLEQHTRVLTFATIQTIEYQEKIYAQLGKCLYQHNPVVVLEEQEYTRKCATQSLLIQISEQIRRYEHSIQSLSKRINDAMRMLVNNYWHIYLSQVQALELLSPLEVLSRGYSITSNASGTLHYVDNVHIGSTILTRLHNGELTSKITNITKNV